jgi:hypothetical protein
MNVPRIIKNLILDDLCLMRMPGGKNAAAPTATFLPALLWTHPGPRVCSLSPRLRFSNSPIFHLSVIDDARLRFSNSQILD